MFKKLKKKLEDEANADITPGLTLASSNSSISLSGSENSPIKLESGADSLPVLPTSQTKEVARDVNDSVSEKVKGAANGDVLTAQLKNKSEKISVLENKVKELNQQLLGEQQRVRHLLETDSNEKKSRKERELLSQIENLTTEKADLETKLGEAILKSERLAAQRESSEELDGFQSQEMAKVKHLLLKSQQDLCQKQEEVKRYSNELLLANQKVRELESQFQKSKDDISSVKSLHLEKRHLEAEVDRLKQETLKSASRSSHMEKTLGDLTDELDALKHTHEVYKSKNSSLLDEKDNEICHLQERVEVLEKRLSESDLGGDEKMEALLAERKGLEKKLEESRQHLGEVKTTWSEKIHSLENQIFHLNKKMAEDSEDSGQFEKQLEDAQNVIGTLKNDNFRLEEQLTKTQEKLKKLEKDKDEAIEELKERLSSRECELGGKAAQTEAHLVELRKSTSKEIGDLQNRVSELVSSQTENVQKEIETEQKLTDLEDEIKKLKADIVKEEAEKLTAMDTLSNVTAKLEDSQKKASKLENECSKYALDLQDIQSLLQKEQTKNESLKTELDKLMMRNAELSQQIELIRKETEEEKSSRDRENEELEKLVSELNDEVIKLNEKIANLEKEETERQAQNGLNEEQNSTIVELQEQLADRNKTIRLQQQRLGDMKKTLQRELKMQISDGSNRDISTETVHFVGNSTPAIISTTNLLAPDLKRNYGSTSSNGLEGSNNSGSVLKDGTPYDDVNFSYLRHVVFKFMTSPEYEAQHLVRAIAVLLHLTQEEEKFIKDILDWKMSWFGSKPQPGSRYYRTKPAKAPLLLSSPR